MSLNALVRDGELQTRTDAERTSERVLRPFHQFARWQASGAVLLLVCAVGALLWANSPWAIAYEQMVHAPLRLSLGERTLQLDLRHWINDGLMALFFFAVGLEIKREFLVGELGAMEPERFATISVLSRTLDAANSPIQRFEHMTHPWVAFGIVPAFALFNAGVASGHG